jgi:hypothetical protein
MLAIFFKPHGLRSPLKPKNDYSDSDLATSYLIAQMHGMGPDDASPAVEHKGPAMSVIKGGPRSRDQGADRSVEPGSDAEICLCTWNALMNPVWLVPTPPWR